MKPAPTLFAGLLVLNASPAFCRPEAPPPIRVLHWARLPVRVCFVTHGLGQEEEVPTAQAGFSEWGAASRGKISFVRVSDPSKADITVQFVPGRYLSAGTQAVGETTIYSSGGILQKASMRLAEGAMFQEELQATAAHEFGHALGISGHSSDPDDVMYPVETVHFDAQDQPLPGEARTVTAHDLQILASGYPSLFVQSDKKAAESDKKPQKWTNEYSYVTMGVTDAKRHGRGRTGKKSGKEMAP